jgi:hypothetical protein
MGKRKVILINFFPHIFRSSTKKLRESAEKSAKSAGKVDQNDFSFTLNKGI